MVKQGLLWLSVICTVVIGCTGFRNQWQNTLSEIGTIEELDRAAVFNFAIMSDNRGDSPSNSSHFARMVSWISESNARFVIGLGDHVKKGRENSFLTFLQCNTWWHNNFYPNAADGENEFYGKNQGDWGAGGKIFNAVDLYQRKNVLIRKNNCEYYARISIDEYTVHLIQLHYPDQPPESEKAFPEDSRNYLTTILESVEKGPKDIIIACAHSRMGFWTHKLSDDQLAVVMDKCDLVLSATTHYFERIMLPGYENSRVLFINTGSITFPRNCPFGYVEVHVIENPLRLVVQYIDAGFEKRKLQRYRAFSSMKVIGGPVMYPRFKNLGF